LAKAVGVTTARKVEADPMSMTADQIVDRRRLRRKLTFWRVVGFLALFLIIAGAIVVFGNGGTLPRVTTPQIARIAINGFIATDHREVQFLDSLAKDDAIKGVIVAIDSTGGSTTGGEELYQSLRKLAQAKPTVATIGTVGASAAYMAAIATDHIVARYTSLTGSIGVLYEYPEVDQLLDKLGVKLNEQKSAPLKAEPSPFHPPTDDAKAAIDSLIQDTYAWFVGLVADRRHLDQATAMTLADGRIFTGHQAIDVKLVDEIGGEEAALAWLGTKGVDVKLPVRDWVPRQDRGPFSFSLGDAVALWVANAFGLSPDLVKQGVLDRILPENLKLDGLQSVWQAPLTMDR
jgi:protease-4